MSGKSWIVIIIVVLLLCGICFVAGLFFISSTNRAKSDSPDQVYQIGQDVIVGKIRWKVLSVKDLGSELKSENQFTKPLGTSGRFILVRVEVENQDTKGKSFVEGDITDSQGKIFGDNSNAIKFIEDKERCILERLNPNVPRICAAIYDVSADAIGLKLVVGDLAPFGGEARIDLGE